MRALVIAALYLGAIAFGALSAGWAVRAGIGGERVGAWRVSSLTGSADADPYTRARVAIGGLLALNRDETMYYVAATDTKGRPLRARCAYRIEGVAPGARWWSLTAYADDFFLFPDPHHRYSLNGRNPRVDAAGHFVLHTGSHPPAAERDALAWLPTPGDQGLLLTLRVYQPAAALAAAPTSLDPPVITRMGDCR